MMKHFHLVRKCFPDLFWLTLNDLKHETQLVQLIKIKPQSQPLCNLNQSSPVSFS